MLFVENNAAYVCYVLFKCVSLHKGNDVAVLLLTTWFCGWRAYLAA